MQDESLPVLDGAAAPDNCSHPG